MIFLPCKNHAQWQADMTSCGTKCLGRHDCVVSCMEGKSWSSGCAGCWGDLQQCTATHCLTKCIGGRTPDCVTCLKAAQDAGVTFNNAQQLIVLPNASVAVLQI